MNVKEVESSDANVKKYVYYFGDAVAESVLYKYPTYEDRTVICCSTQSGCPVGCRFCGAGDYFVRSLTADEIVDQVDYLFPTNGIDPTKVDKMQIMFMSMGEPLLNMTNLAGAILSLNKKYPQAALLISTSAPRSSDNWDTLMDTSLVVDKVGLQFSVHESTDEARAKLIPFKNKMALTEMADTGKKWHVFTGRKPYFNYCVHENNNTIEDADRLFDLFDPNVFCATISVICERDESIAAANSRQLQLAQDFSSLLLQRGYDVRVFNPAGQDDIGGGCGQLWFVQDWMKNNPEKAKKSVGYGKDKVHTPTLIKES